MLLEELIDRWRYRASRKVPPPCTWLDAVRELEAACGGEIARDASQARAAVPRDVDFRRRRRRATDEEPGRR